MSYLNFQSFIVTALWILLETRPKVVNARTEDNGITYFKEIVLGRDTLLTNRQCLLEGCVSKYGLPLGERIYPLSDDSITRFEKVTKPLNLQLQSSGRRIIGGRAVSIKDFPYVVSLHQGSIHVCGGSYIGGTWILSAAHCMVRDMIDSPLKNPSEFRAMMGSAVIEGDKEALRDLQIRKVVMLYPHPEYTRAIALNDIGLVRIEKEFVLKNGVSFVPLPKDAYDGEYRPETCTVIGWGTTSAEKNISKTSPALLSVDIPLITIGQCQKKYDVDRIVPLKIICASEEQGGKDACQGDSGGPIICRGIQVGIVSWGRECGHEDHPGVYTRVDYYLDWIKQTMLRDEDIFVIDPNLYNNSGVCWRCTAFYKYILLYSVVKIVF